MPAIMFNSVVLPDPDGPIRATKSPSTIFNDTPSSAITSCVSRLKALRTLIASINTLVETAAAAMLGIHLSSDDIHVAFIHTQHHALGGDVDVHQRLRTVGG